MDQMILQIGFPMKEQMIGDNVIKITPETYEEMNKEFEEQKLAFRIEVPTQKQIDDWRQGD